MRKSKISTFIVTLFVFFISSSYSKNLPIKVWPISYENVGRIVNGYLANPGQFPHQVAMVNKRINLYTICGGSIISDDYILTAAHCANGVLSTTISFGTTDRHLPYFTLQSTEKKIHENYDSTNLNNDIALWRLPRKITFNDRIKPIQLPTQLQASNSFENYSAVVSGYGRDSPTSTTTSRYLRYAPVKVVGNPKCATIYGSHVVISSTICVIGYEFDQQGPCNGDSGGPLTLKKNGSDILVGVASFVSSKGCGTDRPSGFVRTSSYLTWLHENAKINIV